MNNKILAFVLGIGIFILLVAGSIALGGASMAFVHIPSAMIVVGVAGGLGLATYKGGGLIAFIGCSKRFCILAGVIGAMIGCVQMLQNLKDPAHIGSGLAICLLTVFYGVICYCIAEAIVTKAAD